jgi:hypothetical protein
VKFGSALLAIDHILKGILFDTIIPSAISVEQWRRNRG